MNESDYFALVAEQLISDLTRNIAIKRFTTNTDVIGAFAESTVRQFISRFVSPVRASTGAIISPELCSGPKTLPQIDIILWIPNPLPAVFESNDFGLIPRMSCVGFVEVKRSAYSGVGKKLGDLIERETSLVAPNACNENQCNLSLGVICVRETTVSDSALDELITNGKVVVLMTCDESGTLIPNPSDIFKLINFLQNRCSVAKDIQRTIEMDLTNMASTTRTIPKSTA